MEISFEPLNRKMMKRITLLTGLVLFFFSSWAQPDISNIQLSFTANPSLNWLNTTSEDVSRQGTVMGYDFGIIGDVFFSDNAHYSLLTGLLVLNTGGSLNFRGDQDFNFAGKALPPNTEIRYRLRYLEVPFSIKLKTDEFHRVFYWGVFGLSPMINIGANGKFGTYRRININEEVNLFNVAMNVGVGFDFDLGGNNSASAGLIFQNGLSDITTDNPFNDKTILNSLKIRLGLIF